jgi:pre-mRNA-splicing factor CWC22
MMQNPEGMGNEKMGDGDEDSSDVETKKKGTGVVQPNMAINYQKEIEDFTDQDLVQLRKTIYLVITSALTYEECCHKLLKLQIRPGQEIELCNMVIECCM